MSNKIIPALVTVILLASSALARAQQEVPEVISPLRVESDHNDVNIVSGKTQMRIPVLSTPAAPNLRFDRVQNAAPYMRGDQSGVAGEITQATYSVHTGTGTSESFNCPDFDCTSITGTGSTFVPNANVYHQGGTGLRIHFDLKHVQTTGNPNSRTYYASSASYPNGETITYTYETASLPGDMFNRTFYRPTKVTSNLGYFISIDYHPGSLESGTWGSPSQATLYKSTAPTALLGRLSYELDGTITDHGTNVTDSIERVYICTGCANVLGAGIERSSGSLQLPGEPTPAVEITAVSGASVVGSVSLDSVQWNYAYTNLHISNSNYLYDRVRVTGPNGYDTIYDIRDRNFRNVIDRITDSIGRVTDVDYDDAYRLREIVYPEGNEVRVVYDTFGNITSRTTQPKPSSGQSAVTETANYPASSCSSAGFNILCYRPTWFRDGLGRQTDFDEYNTAGQLEEQTDPADAIGVRRKTYIEYDSSPALRRRRVVRICGDSTTCGTPNEIRTEYDYWENTFLPSVERRIDGARGETLETHYEYDAVGRLKVEDGPLPGTGDAKYYDYDDFGRRTWEIGPADPSGIRLARKLRYRDADDKVDRVEEGSVSSPADRSLTVFRRTDHLFDAWRNVKRDTLVAAGTTQGIVQRTFTQRGQLQCETRRMNPAAFGSLPSSACTLGAEGSFGPDRITRNVYDDAGQLLEVQRAYGTPLEQSYATYTYTPNGKQKTVKDANSNLSTFEYDGFDRLQKLRFPVATKGANQSSTTDYEQYGYDDVGNRTSIRKRDGRTITYTYDALNRVRVKTVPASVSGSPAYNVRHGYDVRGSLTYARFSSDTGQGITNTYDGFGRLMLQSSNLGGATRNISSDYDARGNRTRITHPDGKFFEYAYDDAGRPLHLSENGPSATLASIFYNTQLRRDEIARDSAGAITTYDYDDISRLEVLTHDLDGTGTGNDVTLSFDYNPASQIDTRGISNNAYEFPFSAGVRAYAVNGRNQYTQVGGTTHTWDANGNLTSDGLTTFGYDTENRLVSASGAKNATLSYDPLGRLYQITSSAGTTRFLHDGDRLIAEYNGSSTLLRRYVHGARVDEPLVWYEGATVSAAKRQYLHADHQGSIVAVSKNTGAKVQVHYYDSYGVTATGNTARFQYTGQAAIPELGLLYYKARMYNPTLGRFMQTDPIGYNDDVNLYTYVYNDPLNKVDPTGLCQETDKIKCETVTGSRIKEAQYKESYIAAFMERAERFTKGILDSVEGEVTVGKQGGVKLDLGPFKVKAMVGSESISASLTPKRFFEGDLRIEETTPVEGDSAYQEVSASFGKWQLGLADPRNVTTESTSPHVPTRTEMQDSIDVISTNNRWTRDALKIGVHISLFGGARVGVDLQKLFNPYSATE